MRNADDQPPQCLISVVDDDRSVRAALSNLLNSAGYTPKSFESAEAFLASDQLRLVHCAILDVKLKGMDGFDLQERVLDLHIGLPVIFVSGHGSRTALERAAALGAVAFLRKPIDVDTLLGYIKRALTASGAAS